MQSSSGSIDNNENSLFSFADDTEYNTQSETVKSHILLSVEDDEDYQNSLILALDGLQVQEQHVTVLTANSAADAAAILAARDDIGVILLDVVMENDDAGLLLVNTIRNVIGNDRVRVVLLTGQPGMAPREDVMKEYDIDEYWNKVDLTEEKLRSLVSSNFRSFISLHELYIAKRGLQMIVEASRSITSKQEINEFTHTVLEEVSKVIGIPESGGIVCAYQPDNSALTQCPIVAAIGSLDEVKANSLGCFVKQYSNELNNNELMQAINRALAQKEHQFIDGWSILCFSTADIDDQHYLVIVRAPRLPLSSDIALLKVFSENIANGFTNLALLNKLSSLAYFDNPFHIPNRNWMIRELRTMTHSERDHSILILLDIQNFSETEITLGREYTNTLMTALLCNLRQLFPRVHSLALTGGDSFALLFHKGDRPSVSQLYDISEQPLTLNGLEHNLMLNICVIDLASMHNLPPERLLPIAEMALATECAQGESIHFLEADFPQQVEARYNLLSELHQAITEQQGLELAFQPKVDMQTGQAVGLEALIRWQKPNGNQIPPSDFIPLAEASGLMSKVDTLVMEKTFEAAITLQNENVFVPISFNVTCSDITNKAFIQTLKERINQGHVPANMIEIELTESQAMEDYREVNPILEGLLQMGIKVNIDDFGTGYSSLAHITNLAASTLKVDRSFVNQLTGEDPDAAIAVCDMVRRLGHRFNFELIAEGVETEAQKQRLLESGFLVGQGYYFARPMFLNECIQWLKSNSDV